MEGQPLHRILATLSARASREVGPGRIAAGVVELCTGVASALTPIVGPRGVAALYKRSLHLASQEHASLRGLQEQVQSEMELAPLRERLATLTDADAALVGGALLVTFYELLGSLVGPSLTERLLRSLWDRPLSDPPASETSP